MQPEGAIPVHAQLHNALLGDGVPAGFLADLLDGLDEDAIVNSIGERATVITPHGQSSLGPACCAMSVSLAALAGSSKHPAITVPRIGVHFDFCPNAVVCRRSCDGRYDAARLLCPTSMFTVWFARAAKGIVGSLHNKSALIDYQKPMGVLNQIVSHKAGALALVNSPSWLPQASR